MIALNRYVLVLDVAEANDGALASCDGGVSVLGKSGAIARRRATGAEFMAAARLDGDIGVEWKKGELVCSVVQLKFATDIPYAVRGSRVVADEPVHGNVLFAKP
jgi:hypothetical protein